MGRQTAQAEIKTIKVGIAKDEQEKADWETDITSVDGTVRENDRRIAVLEHAQRTKAREIQDCIGEAANLRKQVNALLIEGSLTEIRTYRQKVSQKKQQIADFQEEIRRMSARRHALEYRPKAGKRAADASKHGQRQQRIYDALSSGKRAHRPFDVYL